jgi:hypothetical protein
MTNAQLSTKDTTLDTEPRGRRNALVLRNHIFPNTLPELVVPCRGHQLLLSANLDLHLAHLALKKVINKCIQKCQYLEE